jgi:hypothetical protein
MQRIGVLLCIGLVTACGPGVSNGDFPDAGRSGHQPDGSLYADAAPQPDVDTSQQQGCSGVNNCYTVYAHTKNTLYIIDLMAKTLVEVGPFNAPSNDAITDMAVMPDGTVYAVSNTKLYTVSTTDGHVTEVAALAACGSSDVAMTATPDGKLYAGDLAGAFCEIDVTQSPPTINQIASSLGQGLALSGDLVTVDDGTMFGTSYYTADASGTKSHLNNLLVTVDPTTGTVKDVIGQTGYPQLFGISYAQGQVFGFTDDGSGDVITIDITTGVGTVYATFKDSSNNGIRFWGAAVNPKVPKIIS